MNMNSGISSAANTSKSSKLLGKRKKQNINVSDLLSPSHMLNKLNCVSEEDGGDSEETRA